MAINDAMGSEAFSMTYKGLLMPEGPRKRLFFKMTGPGCDLECFGWIAKGPPFEWKDKARTSAGVAKGGDFKTWYVGISLGGSQKGPFKEPPSGNALLWKRLKAWEIIRDEAKLIINHLSGGEVELMFNKPGPVQPAYHGSPFNPQLLPPASILPLPHRPRPYPAPPYVLTRP
ncbi:hypothetical protein BDP27DRAFT_1416456 [Rhodocollybia butyracea]|uniref:Uncharacterized protein n=1 Tax=Rhodocollybia butyracea TaxID=206335 RepID=A0A9P5Q277_9AGAR|nr:hypothetical protein BDP27DRAFT_1416456 [Rhodocollybia butyracea]